jgi:peroxiredoxin
MIRRSRSLSLLAALAFTSLLAACALSQDAPPPPLALGSKAPLVTVKMKSVDGTQLSLNDLAGKKGTLVVFTCNHCPWAQAWQSRVAEIGNAARKNGIGVVAINSNDPAAYPEDDFAPMQERAKLLKLDFPYVMDATSELAKAFGATKTPEAFLFDKSGKLVYHGTIDDNAREPEKVTRRWLRDAVDAVVAGKSVATGETKAFGCGIKYRAKA